MRHIITVLKLLLGAICTILLIPSIPLVMLLGWCLDTNGIKNMNNTLSQLNVKERGLL